MDVAQMPADCELAAWYLSHAPKGYVYGFLAKLVEYLDQYPDCPESPEILDFLECVLPMLP